VLYAVDFCQLLNEDDDDEDDGKITLADENTDAAVL